MCCRFAIEAYKFRQKSIISDKKLKEDVEKLEPIPKIHIMKKFVIRDPSNVQQQNTKSKRDIHSSVESIMRNYPTLKYPPGLKLHANYGPYVTLMESDITNWYNNHPKKSDDEDEKDSTWEVEEESKLGKSSNYIEESSSTDSNSDVEQIKKSLNQFRRARKRARSICMPRRRILETDSDSESSERMQKRRRAKSVCRTYEELMVSVDEDESDSSTNRKRRKLSKDKPPSQYKRIQTPSQYKRMETSSYEPLKNGSIDYVQQSNNSPIKVTNNIRLIPPFNILLLPQLNIQNLMGNIVNNPSIIVDQLGNEALKSQFSNAEETLKKVISDETIPKESTTKNDDAITIQTGQTENANDTMPKENIFEKNFTTTILENLAENDKETMSDENMSNNRPITTIIENVAENANESMSNENPLKDIVNSNTSVLPSRVEIVNHIEDINNESSTSKSLNKNDQEFNECNTSEADKIDFVKSLNLQPKTSPLLQTQDMLSHITSSETVYTCSVCYSLHKSKRELKIHQNKYHTKCTICKKKFRTLEGKYEHLKTKCSYFNKPGNLQDARVVLTRLEHIADIKETYKDVIETQLFGKINESSDTESELNLVIDDSDNSSEQHKEKESTEYDVNTSTGKKTSESPSLNKTTTIDSQSDINNKLQDANRAIHENTNEIEIEQIQPEINNSLSSTKETHEIRGEPINTANKTAQENIICISDDDDDDVEPNRSEAAKVNHPPLNFFPTTSANTAQANRINVDVNVNMCSNSSQNSAFMIKSATINDINLEGNDVHIIKQLLKKGSQTCQFPALPENPIIPGKSGKTHLLKNLYKELHLYKIPIQLSHSNNLNVKYAVCTEKNTQKKKDYWYDLKAIDLKRRARPRKQNLSLIQTTDKIVDKTPKSSYKLQMTPVVVSIAPKQTATIVTSQTSPFRTITSTPVASRSSPFRTQTVNAVTPNGSPLITTTLTAVTSQASPFQTATLTTATSQTPLLKSPLSSTGAASQTPFLKAQFLTTPISQTSLLKHQAYNTTPIPQTSVLKHQPYNATPNSQIPKQTKALVLNYTLGNSLANIPKNQTLVLRPNANNIVVPTIQNVNGISINGPTSTTLISPTNSKSNATYKYCSALQTVNQSTVANQTFLTNSNNIAVTSVSSPILLDVTDKTLPQNPQKSVPHQFVLFQSAVPTPVQGFVKVSLPSPTQSTATSGILLQTKPPVPCIAPKSKAPELNQHQTQTTVQSTESSVTEVASMTEIQNNDPKPRFRVKNLKELC